LTAFHGSWNDRGDVPPVVHPVRHSFHHRVGSRWRAAQVTNTCHVLAASCDQGHDGVAVRSAAPPKGNIMKAVLVAGLLGVSSFAALAQSGNGETWGQNLTSGGEQLTRSQVVAALHEAQARQAIAFGELSSGDVVAAPASALSRNQVRSEVMSMRSAGRHPALGEHSPGIL
jgi:hypothetical protein